MSPKEVPIHTRKVPNAESIVAAATVLFEEKGYRGTTIDEIARKAGMAKPTVYQYVGSKGELLEAIFAKVLGRMDANFAELEGVDDRLEQLVLFVRNYAYSVFDLQPYYRIFFGEEHELPAETRLHFHDWSRRMTERMVGLVRAAQDDGVVRPELDPRLTVFLVVGMLSSMSRWYRPTPWTRERIVAELVTLLSSALTPGHPDLYELVARLAERAPGEGA